METGTGEVLRIAEEPVRAISLPRRDAAVAVRTVAHLKFSKFF